MIGTDPRFWLSLARPAAVYAVLVGAGGLAMGYELWVVLAGLAIQLVLALFLVLFALWTFR